MERAPGSNANIRSYMFTEMRIRYNIDLETDAEARGALFGTIRVRFQAMRRPDLDPVNFLLKDLTCLQKDELEVIIREDCKIMMNLY